MKKEYILRIDVDPLEGEHGITVQLFSSILPDALFTEWFPIPTDFGELLAKLRERITFYTFNFQVLITGRSVKYLDKLFVDRDIIFRLTEEELCLYTTSQA